MEVLVELLKVGEESGSLSKGELKGLSDVVQLPELLDYAIDWTCRSLEDLRQVWKEMVGYLSEDQVSEGLREILEAIGLLSEDGHQGKSMNYVREYYRFVLAGEYIVFYREGDDGQVEIIRVLHQSCVQLKN